MRLLFPSLMALSLILSASSAYGSKEIDLPADETMRPSPPKPSVSQEAIDTIDFFRTLFNENEFDEILKNIKLPKYTLQDIGFDLYDRFRYITTLSFGGALHHKAQQRGLDRRLVMNYLQVGIQCLEGYLEEFKNKTPPNSDYVSEFRFHQYEICSTAGFMYDELLKEISGDDNYDAQREAAVSSYLRYEQALKYISLLSGKLRETTERDLPDLQYKIFLKCHALCQLIPQEETYLTRACQLRHSLRGTSYYEKTEKFLEHLDKIRLDQRRERLAQTASSQHRKTLYGFIQQSRKDLQQLLDEVNRDNAGLSLRAKIVDLKNTSAPQSPEQVPEALARIREIEKRIGDELSLDSSTNRSSSDLRSIYQVFCHFFEPQTQWVHVLFTAATFIHGGDIEEAIKRIEALREFSADEAKKRYDHLLASLRCLNGEPQSLEILLQEAQKKKSAKRARQRARIAETIRAEIEQKARQEALEAELKQMRDVTTKSVLGETGAAAAASSDRSLEVERTLLPFSVFSAAEEKAARLERHQQKEKERALARALEQEEFEVPGLESVGIEPERGAAMAQRPEPAQGPIHLDMREIAAEIRLPEIKGLTGAAHATFNNIREERWNLTRDQVLALFQDLRCTVHMGKGSHIVIRSRKGDIVGVLGVDEELATSLSLPKWKDAVPHYLRKQIRSLVKVAARLYEQDQVASSSDTKDNF